LCRNGSTTGHAVLGDESYGTGDAAVEVLGWVAEKIEKQRMKLMITIVSSYDTQFDYV
jgi:hypothetical protein